MVENQLIGPADPLYSSRITATYIKFLKKRYPHVDIPELLTYARMEPYQVQDESCWFTQEQVDRFNECVVKMTGKPNIAREVGRFGLSADSIGFVQTYILGRVSISRAFEMIAQISPKFVRSSTFESKKLGSNKFLVRAMQKPGAQEKPYQCQNRMGYFEAGSDLFKQKFPQVEHSKCVFKGDDCCEFEITWHESRYAVWRKARAIGGTLVLAATGLMFLLHHYAGFIATSTAIATLFAFSSRLWQLERKELYEGIDNLSKSTDEVVKGMERSIKNMDFTRKLMISLSLEGDPEGMMNQITSLFRSELDYDRGAIFLVNKDRTNLEYYGGFGYTEEQEQDMRRMNSRLRPDSTGVFTVCLMQRKPFLVNNVNDIFPSLSPRSFDFAKRMGTKSFICVPIISSNDTLGVLAVDNLITKRPLLQSDLDLLMNIAPEIGMAIQNARSIIEKERQFDSILQALASSIDARDPLTAGHSERVTRFAVGIAREMKLPYETVEMIRVAALLHDYGKIGIADSILKKPGKLTDSEYAEIKTHATKTKQILDKIEFQGIYKEVPKIALSHHEKFNGTGYPAGLSREAIPLGARILAVADVFEAVTAKRHYRNPMPLPEAFELLQRDKGKHFDPVVLEAFLRYYEKEGSVDDKLYALASRMSDKIEDDNNTQIQLSIANETERIAKVIKMMQRVERV